MPLIGYFKGEAGYERVRGLIRRIEEGNIDGFISVITLIEVYYKYFREAGEEIAMMRTDQLRFSSLQIVPIEDRIALLAGEIKGKHAIPIADAVIGATAIILDGVLVSDDSHFEEIEGLKVLKVGDLDEYD
jgi:predicted nucleic acid-binding protein